MTEMMTEGVEMLDLSGFEDIEIPCEVPSYWPEFGCEAPPAEWVAYKVGGCTCYLRSRLMCTSCKDRHINLVARGAAFRCHGCGARGGTYSRFEPLARS